MIAEKEEITIATEQELVYLRKKFSVYATFWLENPIAFIYDLKIAKLLPYQAEILNAIVHNKRTLVKSGHGAGKTFIMALAASWWMSLHWIKGEGCSVIATSPSAANLTNIFWAQFSKCIDCFPKYLKDQFVLTNESAYQIEDAKGWRLDLRTARKDNPDSLQGAHNVLFLVDEWSGVPIEIYKVIEGAMSDEPSRILGIGNPIRRSGWGYDAFHTNKDLWKLITIDCSKYTDDKTFVTTYSDILGNEHSSEVRGRVSPQEIQKWLDVSGGDLNGMDYLIRVRGEFPVNGKNQFIAYNVIQPCFKREFYSNQKKHHTLGLDPATSGGDEIALVHRWGNNIISIKTWQESDTRQIAYQVRDWITSIGKEFTFEFISIDAIGDGKGVYDSLEEMKAKGELPNIQTVRQFKGSFEAPNKERFERLRDEVWSRMREWFITNKPHFAEDYTSECEALREELVSITSDFNAFGKLKLESKKDMRKRGVKSPNIADALSMTFMNSDDSIEEVRMDRYQRAILRRSQNNNYNLDWRAV